jgi:hypothetical protein
MKIQIIKRLTGMLKNETMETKWNLTEEFESKEIDFVF